MESPVARLRGRGETSGGALPFSLLQLQTALPLKRHGIRSLQPRLPAGNFGGAGRSMRPSHRTSSAKTQRLTMPVLRTCSASSGSSWTSNSTPSIASAARAIRGRRRRFGTCRCVSESRCGPVRRVEVVQCLTSPPPSAPNLVAHGNPPEPALSLTLSCQVSPFPGGHRVPLRMSNGSSAEDASAIAPPGTLRRAARRASPLGLARSLEPGC
jgi:hypothetical protein